MTPKKCAPIVKCVCSETNCDIVNYVHNDFSLIVLHPFRKLEIFLIDYAKKSVSFSISFKWKSVKKIDIKLCENDIAVPHRMSVLTLAVTKPAEWATNTKVNEPTKTLPIR